MANYCKYYKQQRYVSYDSGVTWQPLNEYQKGELYEYNSSDCGYEEIYRWVTMSGASDYWCSGTTKMSMEKKQISTDSGQTWSDTNPLQTRSGSTVIEANSEDCGYVPSSGYADEYLTFIPRTASSKFIFTKSVQFSLDSGNTWTTLAANTSSPSVSAGQKIMWKGTEAPSGARFWTATSNFDVEGNTMSLLYGDDFRGKTTLLSGDRTFYNLFSNNSYVVNAENMVLPATALTSECYEQMFRGCTSLETAPELPAMTLTDSCYINMFKDCTSLTTAMTELPATTLTDSCYHNMFAGCTSLATAPVLSATTLAHVSCVNMFSGCTSLTIAPELPATTVAETCCYGMFQGCTALTTAMSVLPATTLVEACYEHMFSGCTSLETAPQLPATTLAKLCYQYMFAGCTSLVTAPTLPATALTIACYDYMFNGCSSLSSITCMANENYPRYKDGRAVCTGSWVCGVASSGTFTKAANSTWEDNIYIGCDAIPDGWTVITV